MNLIALLQNKVFLFIVILFSFIFIHEGIHYGFAYIFELQPWLDTSRSGLFIVWWQSGGPIIDGVILHAPSAMFLLLAIGLFRIRWYLPAAAFTVAFIHAVVGHALVQL